MDIKDIAKTLFNTHRKPVVKFELVKAKLFTPSGTKEEESLLNHKLESIKSAVDHIRVERRCARAKMKWIEMNRLAELTHAVGSKMQFMRYQNKNGKFLFPEEALFLLETNRAEMSWNNVPVSLDQCYSILLTSCVDLQKYVLYRHLSLKGFSLQRRELQDDEVISPPPKKLKLEGTTPCSFNQTTNADTNVRGAIDFENLLTKLRESGCQMNNTLISSTYDYKMSIRNTKEHQEVNFKFMFEKELDPCAGFYTDSENTIYGRLTEDNFSFFTLECVDLPILPV